MISPLLLSSATRDNCEDKNENYDDGYIYGNGDDDDDDFITNHDYYVKNRIIMGTVTGDGK